MASPTIQNISFLGRPATPSAEVVRPPAGLVVVSRHHPWRSWTDSHLRSGCSFRGFSKSNEAFAATRVSALDRNNGGGGSSKSGGGDANGKKASVPNSNYVVPLDKSLTSSCFTRPLVEILRDLNKRIPDNIIKKSVDGDKFATFLPWYHANRMLSFYAPGWCGDIRDVIFSDNGTVTVVYRVIIRGSDGEAYRECSGTVSSGNSDIRDPVAAAEEIAFCRACARFGLGLYLYHE